MSGTKCTLKYGIRNYKTCIFTERHTSWAQHVDRSEIHTKLWSVNTTREDSIWDGY